MRRVPVMPHFSIIMALQFVDHVVVIGLKPTDCGEMAVSGFLAGRGGHSGKTIGRDDAHEPWLTASGAA